MTSTPVSACGAGKNLRFDEAPITRKRRPVEADPAGRRGPRWTVSAGRPGDQQVADLLRVGRPAEPPALSEIAADRGEPALLRRRLDALGGHRHLQHVTQLHEHAE